MPLYRSEAVVLRTYKLGEADRIVVLLTRARGKVRAVAKGVRRTRSKFGARLEPASIIQGQFYEGRSDLDIVDQVETVTRLTNLRSDLDRYGRAATMLEIADQVTVDAEPHPTLFKVLTGALIELDKTGNPLIIPSFVTKVLELDGVQPQVTACVACGRNNQLVALDIVEGGTFCVEHRRGEPISEGARLALAAVLDRRVRQVLDDTDPMVAAELEVLGAKLAENHLERRLRSPRTVDAEWTPVG